jgi:hypothetical protein
VNSASCLRLVDADFEDIGDQRQTDRRSTDRRAPRPRLDPRFAATLINQIAKPERVQAKGYANEPKRLRPGIAFDLKA